MTSKCLMNSNSFVARDFFFVLYSLLFFYEYCSGVEESSIYCSATPLRRLNNLSRHIVVYSSDDLLLNKLKTMISNDGTIASC